MGLQGTKRTHEPHIAWRTPIHVTNDALTVCAYNSIRSMLSCGSKSGILTLIRSKNEYTEMHDYSSIRLSDDALRCLDWVNDHEFACSGANLPLMTYDIILRQEDVQRDGRRAEAIHTSGHMLMAGTVEGSLDIYDNSRMGLGSPAARVLHRFNNRTQPVVSIESDGELIYTGTVCGGRVWVWDRRNLSRRMKVVHSGLCPAAMKAVGGSLCVLENNYQITRYSSDLRSREVLWKEKDGPPAGGGYLGYCAVANTLVWTRPGCIRLGVYPYSAGDDYFEGSSIKCKPEMQSQGMHNTQSGWPGAAVRFTTHEHAGMGCMTLMNGNKFATPMQDGMICTGRIELGAHRG